MNDYLKKAALICVCVFTVVLSAGCSGQSEPQSDYDLSTEASSIDSVVVAENSLFDLEWDNVNKAVLLFDKTSGKRWGTTPESALPDGEISEDDEDAVINHSMVESALAIEYIEPGSMTVKNVFSSIGAVKNGRVFSEKIKNGIKVTYCFDEAEISVPVSYILQKDSLKIAIDPKEIDEHQNKVYRIAVAPMLSSVKNNTDNSYLFVPSGSGALISVEDVPDGKTFSDEVFGADLARNVLDKPVNTQPVCLPVFGIKDNDSGLFAVLENGAESASIDAQAGNERIKYSSVYSNFYMRGYNVVETKIAWEIKSAKLFSEEMMIDPISVVYFPLGPKNADYTAMANLYSRYLSERGELPAASNDSLLFLKIYGGAMIKKFFLGVPYNSLQPATTVNQARQMMGEIIEKTGEKPVVNLLGFTESGVNVGKVAGNYRLNDQLGGKKELKKIVEYGEQQNIPLYMDFDIVHFSKSGNGFSAAFDKAKTANRQTVYRHYYSVSLLNPNENYDPFMLLQRKQLKTAAEKLLLKPIGEQLGGISLGSLGSKAYSDFSEARYVSKAGMAEDVKEIVETMKQKNKRIAMIAPNVYAASHADHIFDAPVTSSRCTVFSADVPFYQMVFKGYVPLACPPVNDDPDPQSAVLRAVEGGSGITFSLLFDYDARLMNSSQQGLWGSVYADNIEQIETVSAALEAYHKAVGGRKITGHEILENQVRKTVFDNNTVVYVNYSGKPARSPAGEIAPHQFLLVTA